MMTETREQELERMRVALKHLVDLTIDNLFDDGREGGCISEGDLPTVNDFVDMMNEQADLIGEGDDDADLTLEQLEQEMKS